MGRRAFSLATTFVLVGATVVLFAASASAATVTTEAELRAAFAADTTVDLGTDITLTDCSAGDGGSLLRPVTNTDPVTLDGHGFTITQTCTSNAVVQNSSAGLTVRNLTVTGGDTDGSGGGVFSLGDLTIEDSVLTGNKADGAGGGAVDRRRPRRAPHERRREQHRQGRRWPAGQPRRHRDRLERLRQHQRRDQHQRGRDGDAHVDQHDRPPQHARRPGRWCLQWW